MGRMVKRLSNLEIDEVSLVDTPANQHGLVAIAKSYQEDNMAVFDANGDEVFEEELSNGDLVYDESGTEYVFTEGNPADDDDYDDSNGDVEKGVRSAVARRAIRGTTVAREPVTATSRWSPGKTMDRVDRGILRAGMSARGAAGNVRAAGARTARRAEQAGESGRRSARNIRTAAGMQYRAIPENGRRGIRYGGAALGGAGAAEGVEHYRKSFSDEVLTSLSKALTDDDRDQVIAKAMSYVEDVASRNADLEDAVADLLEQRELESYGAVAKGYGQLPVEEQELAGVLMRASQYLPDEDLAVLDRVFAGAGEVTKAYFDEVGVAGYGESGVLEQVYGIANSAISKSADGTSQEQAVTAIFDTNPAAYDEYELEQRQR